MTQAFVTLANLDRRTLSDSTGTIVFPDVPPGTHQLVVRHIGYGEQTLPIEVESMTSVVLAIELTPVAIAVTPLEIQIEHRPRFLEDRGFYHRRVVGLGTFFDPEFVHRWGVGGWASAGASIDLRFDMAPRFHPSRIGCLGGGAVVYIDGVRAGKWSAFSRRNPVDTPLLGMSTWQIGAVELYPTTHGVPEFAFGPDATCGVIVVWTDGWTGRGRRLGGGDVQLCEPAREGTRVASKASSATRSRASCSPAHG